MAEKRASRKRYAPGEREEIEEAIKAVEAFVARDKKAAKVQAASPPPKAKAAGPPPKAAGPPPKAKAATPNLGVSASSSQQPKAKATKQDTGASASSSHQPKAAVIKGPDVFRLIAVPPTLERIFNEEFAEFEKEALAVDMGSSEEHVRHLLYRARNFTMGSLLLRGFLEKSECSHYLNMRQSGEEVGRNEANVLCRKVEQATQIGLEHAKTASRGVQRHGDDEGGHSIDATIIRDIKRYSRSEVTLYVREFSYPVPLIEALNDIMVQFTSINTVFSSKAWNHARGGGGLLSAVLAIDVGPLPPGFTKAQIVEMVRLYVRGIISSDMFFVFNGRGEYAFSGMSPDGIDQAMIRIISRCILRGAKNATSLTVFNATSDTPSKSRHGKRGTDFSTCPAGIAAYCEEQVESAVKDDAHLHKWLKDGITTLCAEEGLTDIGKPEQANIAKVLKLCASLKLDTKYTDSVVSSVGSDITMSMLRCQKHPIPFEDAAKVFDSSVELHVVLLSRLYEHAGKRSTQKGAPLVVFKETFEQSYDKKEISIPATKEVESQFVCKEPEFFLFSGEGQADVLKSYQLAQSAQSAPIAPIAPSDPSKKKRNAQSAQSAPDNPSKKNKSAPPKKKKGSLSNTTGMIHRRSRRAHVNKKTHHYRKYRNRTRRGG